MNLATRTGVGVTERKSLLIRGHLPLAFVLLLLVGVMVASYAPAVMTGLFPDTDDAMRMVEVRDFIAGQGWYDTVATRLSPPGVAMHWSRLVDLPIAALTVVFGWATEPLVAERVAATVWPTILLAIALGLLSRLATEMVGSDGVLLALGMVAASFCVWNYFAPGRVDHHNVQLVLGLCLISTLRRAADHPLLAAVAGGLAATMATVGMESLPWIAAATAWIAVAWVAKGESLAAGLGHFGLGLGGVSVVLLLATQPPSSLFVPHCDAMSIVQGAALVLSGLGLLLIARFISGGRAVRLTSLVLVGAIVVGLLAWRFPECGAGPYAALPPEVVERWLSAVGEARSIVQIALSDPGMLSQYTVAATGLVAAITLAFRDRGRAATWSLVAAVVGVSLVAGLIQVRAVVPATVIAALPIAAAAERLRERSARTRGAYGAAAFLLALFAGSTFAQALAIDRIAGRPAGEEDGEETARPCWNKEAVEDAAALPPGLVLAPIDLGPSILYLTDHAVLGAPYHRNVAGNLAVLDLFAADVRNAEAKASEMNARYVFFCSGRARYETTAEGSLGALLEADEPPAWLVLLPSDSSAGLRMYRIAAQAP